MPTSRWQRASNTALSAGLRTFDGCVFAPSSLARVLGVQYVVGGALTLAWLGLPAGAAVPGRDVVTALGVLALVLGVAMIAVSYVRLSPSALTTASHACILSAQVVIIAAHVATQDPRSHLLLFLLWTTPYAGVFSRRARWMHFAITSGGLAVAAAATSRDEYWRAGVWSVGVLTTVIVVMLLVSRTTRQLRVVATRDALTGLPNRSLFQAAARAALARPTQHGHGQVSVLLIDIDRLQNVNDTFGQHAGDVLLTCIAARLLSRTSSTELVARLSGDGFAVLCTSSPQGADPRDTAARFAGALEEPIEISGHSIFVTVSIGVAEAVPGSTAETLLRDADTALRAAQAANGNCWRVFDPAALRRTPRLVAVEQGLRRAIAREELTLHYQPIMMLADGRALGVEALIRWTSPELGPVTPDEFVTVAESCGLMDEIGRWVLERSLQDLRDWRRTGIVNGQFRVAVNISPHQVTDALPTLVAALLVQHQVPAANLGLEITESAVMVDGTSERVLQALHELGVLLLLDDFGTGFSSLSHLRRFPLQVVKIDRSFVQGMCQAREDRALVSAVLSLACALDLQVVAEGVETHQQLDELRAMGCAAAQGYGLARPVPAQDLSRALAAAALAVAVPTPRAHAEHDDLLARTRQ